MSDLEICRICLRIGCKMYRYDSFKLKCYYEEILGTEVKLPDPLPSYFCYECAALLYKFHKFKIKCYNGQNILKARLATAGLISFAAIKKIDRNRINLITLEVLKASERVKTFIETDSTCIESDIESLDDRDFYINCDTETRDTELVKLEDKSDEEMVLHEENSLESKVTGYQFIFALDTTADTTENLCREQSNIIKKGTDEECKKSCHDNANDSIKLLKGVKDRDKKRVIKKDATHQNRLKRSRYAKQRIQVLDDSLWKYYYLSEENAWKEFRALAEEPKYLAAEHKCGKCYTWFRTRDKLQRHNVLKHGSRGSLECQFCAIRFKLPCDVRRHLQKHYKRFECLKCGLRSCSQNSAFFHQDMHSGARRSCNYCGETFKHSSTFYTHLRTHRSNFVCSLCGQSFVSKLGLDLHKKIKHCTQDGEDELSDDYDTSVNTYCTKCSIQFESRKAYIEHVFQSAAHVEADENELELAPDPARKKILSKTIKEVITSKMKGITKDYWDSVKPRRTVKKKPTTCHQCGEAFETQAACMKHHRKEHPNTTFYGPTERHICEICGANLAKGSIQMHQNMHSREVMHTCETCGKSFHAQISLRRHYLTHTGEKPYPCSLCDKRFTQSNSMKLHYRTFHLKQPYPKRNRRPKEHKDPETAVKTAS